MHFNFPGFFSDPAGETTQKNWERTWCDGQAKPSRTRIKAVFTHDRDRKSEWKWNWSGGCLHPLFPNLNQSGIGIFKLSKLGRKIVPPSLHSLTSMLQAGPTKPLGQEQLYPPVTMLVSQMAPALHGLLAQASFRWQRSPVLPGGHSQ